jgi:hypothetical protein
MNIKDKVAEVVKKIESKYSKTQIKRLIEQKLSKIGAQGGLKNYQLKAVALAYSGMIKRLGMYEVSKERVFMALTGKAEELEEIELISIGQLIKYFNKPALDVVLFVDECKKGLYRE